MRLLPTRRGATLHLAAHTSIVVFAILTVCGLLDVAHVYIQYFFGEGYLTERPPRNTLYNIVSILARSNTTLPPLSFRQTSPRLASAHCVHSSILIFCSTH